MLNKTMFLKYSLEEWDNLFTYSKENELLLDIMYFDSNKILFEYKNILRCSITMNQSYEYTLNKGHFPGMNSILFKNGAIKVLKKQTEVIILIRLLESGFYYTSDYLHQWVFTPLLIKNAAYVKNILKDLLL